MQTYMTMTNIAANTIRKAILRGEYPPESRLIPGRLVDEMGLGLAAIREALREMTGSGLVTSYSNKGYYVTSSPTLKEIKEIFRMRFISERKAAEEGAFQISAKDLDKMKKLHDEMSQNKLNLHDFFLINRDFHFTLYYASGLNSLCKIIERLFDEVLIFRSIIGDTRSNYDVPNSQHLQIINAIEDGDIEAVGNLVLRNLQNGLDNVHAMIKEDTSQDSMQLRKTGKKIVR